MKKFVVELMAPIVNDITKISLFLEKMQTPPMTSNSNVDSVSSGSCHQPQPRNNESLVLDEEIFKPINDKTDLETMVTNLTDNNFRINLMRNLKCSVSFNHLNGKPGKAFYHFIDLLFTRKFFLLVSWTGSSNQEGGKLRFQNYTSVHKFFVNLIRCYEPDYPYSDYVKIMMRVCSNSKGRSEVLFKRQSSPRDKQTTDPVAAAKRQKRNEKSIGAFADLKDFSPETVTTTENVLYCPSIWQDIV